MTFPNDDAYDRGHYKTDGWADDLEDRADAQEVGQ